MKTFWIDLKWKRMANMFIQLYDNAWINIFIMFTIDLVNLVLYLRSIKDDFVNQCVNYTLSIYTLHKCKCLNIVSVVRPLRTNFVLHRKRFIGINCKLNNHESIWINKCRLLCCHCFHYLSHLAVSVFILGESNSNLLRKCFLLFLYLK